ncbi:MAG: CRISPR-associated endonuclease Cas2 [Peptococcaceae bacterium]|nr:CRISPR-associated endonuclease Cas2 [Peptococcaceae bacterium]MDH7524151.1 CRISPR-associated endonuclease Cas2 [Peptococcaceae bacterium]
MEVKLFEDYFLFDETEPEEKRKYLVVVIYDVIDNKRRNRLAKYLKSFGFRVQKSAFECILDSKTHKKLIQGISKYVTDDDLLRIYRLAGNADVQVWGNIQKTEVDEVIVV